MCMSVCKKALITLILLNIKYTFLVDGKTVYKPKSSFHSYTYSHEEKNILMNDEDQFI